MEFVNVLDLECREDFRIWLKAHSVTEKECWLALKRGKPAESSTVSANSTVLSGGKRVFYYLDAVEEALCFGWIDSTCRKINGKTMQRFGPRKKNSPWTELNKERVRRLEKLGKMTPEGRAVLSDMNVESFKIDEKVETALREAGAWENFRAFPGLYQRVRAYNVMFYEKRDPAAFERMLARLAEQSAEGKMYGEWNDYGRLLNY